MKFDVQAALDEILTESIAPAISANPAIPHLKLAGIARIAARSVQTEDIEFDTKARQDDHAIYAEALRIHGPMVERTLAWLGRCRRLVKDFERTIASAEAWIYMANIRMLTRRNARC